MKIWHWFCKLGDQKMVHEGKTGQPQVPIKQVSERVSRSGLDSVCSRVCGHEQCKCGSTIRGLHCVWSYYRIEP